MQTAASSEREPRRINRGSGLATMSHVSESTERLREAMAEAAVRTIWLKGMRAADVRERLSSFRASELAMLNSGNLTKLGLNRMGNLVDALGCKVRAEVLPDPAPAKGPDEQHGMLFKLLSETEDACHAAQDDIGRRSYPLTGIAVRHAGVQCALAIDAIRKAPEFWHREAYSFSAMLFSAEQMLEALTTKSYRVSKALRLLREAGEMLEEVADRVAAARAN